MNSLQNIRVVLVRTFHPGNIGSVARSMKTMGLSDLHLVAPKDFPSTQAEQMAAGANSVLEHAIVHSCLADAIGDCSVVIASTVRPRGYDLPELNPSQTAEMLCAGARTSPVALLFGPERMGLHNDDLELAKYRVTIAANPAYPSLNIAAAVQILCYEIFQASSLSQTVEETEESTSKSKTSRQLPSSSDMQNLFQHLEQVLNEIQFLRPHQGKTMQRLRHLINRAEPDVLENNILRGILSAIQKSRR